MAMAKAGGGLALGPRAVHQTAYKVLDVRRAQRVAVALDANISCASMVSSRQAGSGWSLLAAQHAFNVGQQAAGPNPKAFGGQGAITQVVGGQCFINQSILRRLDAA